MLRRVVLLISVFILAVIFVPQISYASDPHVVINAFQIAGAKSTDEFIELYNPTTESVKLTGWRLAKKTASGNLYNILTSFPDIEIPSGDFIVVAHKDFSGSSDIFYSTSSSFSENNTIVLYSDQGKTVVDKVGYGSVVDFEGALLPNPAAGEVFQRRQNGVDTDNNASDFEKEGTTPGTGDSGDVAPVFITELMPNPTGSDSGEWIELYNGGPEVDLGRYTLSDKIGSPHKYTFPSGTIMASGGYKVFMAGDTKIALNNDGDVVELLAPSGEFADDSGADYGKAKEGLAYAFDGDKWVWTTTPTPGAQNLITEDLSNPGSKKAVTSKKKSKARASTAKKAKAPKAKSNILGASSEGDVFGEGEEPLSDSDRLLGYILIGVALFGGLGYTVFVNRNKLREVFVEQFGGYKKAWSKIRSKLPWR